MSNLETYDCFSTTGLLDIMTKVKSSQVTFQQDHDLGSGFNFL